MSPSFKYRAFISYSHKDAKWAKWLHRALERYVVPIDAFASEDKLEADGTEKTRRLTPVFRDRDELPAAGSLSDTIQQALESSENLIVLCSPNSAASQYVNAEIEIFRGLHPDNENKIYALIIEGEPPDCFPPALLAGGAEPIAADAREVGDGKGDAKLKLIAGMLGVGFDRLKRREAKRQRNRLLVMVSVVSAVAVMTSVLALWAMKAEQATKEALVSEAAQRKLAEQRQMEAEEARQATEKALSREEEQRKLAEQSAKESKAVLGFYNSKVLGAAKTKAAPGGLGIDVTIRKAMDAAEPQIEKSFAGQALIEASVRMAMGQAYSLMSDREAAITQYERAFEVRKKELGPGHYDTLGSMVRLSNDFIAVNRNAEALVLNEELVRQAKDALGEEHPFTLLSLEKLMASYRRAGRIAEAIAIIEKVIGLKKKILGAENPSTLYSMYHLAVSYRLADRHEESVKLHEEILRLRKKVLGPEHVQTLGSMYELGNSYADMGKREEAIKWREEVVRLSMKVNGAEHPFTLDRVGELASSYVKVGRLEEGIAMKEKSLRLKQKVLSEGNITTVMTMRDLALIYYSAGQLKDAERQYLQLLAVEKKKGAKNWLFYNDQRVLGEVFYKQKKYSEAEPLLLSAYEGLNATLFSNNKHIGQVYYAASYLRELYQEWGKPEKATKWQEIRDVLKIKWDAAKSADNK